MTLTVAFRAAARREMVEAAAWYETRKAGLGAEFIEEVRRCVAGAAERPELYAVVHRDVRRAATRRFPFSIFYRCRADRIVVLAVFHSSRDPRVWQGR